MHFGDAEVAADHVGIDEPRQVRGLALTTGDPPGDAEAGRRRPVVGFSQELADDRIQGVVILAGKPLFPHRMPRPGDRIDQRQHGFRAADISRKDHVRIPSFVCFAALAPGRRARGVISAWSRHQDLALDASGFVAAAIAFMTRSVAPSLMSWASTLPK